MHIHLDLEAGISGNMFLGACLELGLEPKVLRAALAGLNLPGWQLDLKRGRRGGIRGIHAAVRLLEPHSEHRSLGQILALIHGSGLPDPVKKQAVTIFVNLAEAEAAVHGIPVDQVQFHEVGAVDAIIDICAAAFAVWRLGVTRVTASPVPTGSGFVQCAHGRMPVPVPAVVELLRRFRAPLRPDPVEAELVTPTGAAILVTLAEQYGPPEIKRVDRVGYGLGSRDLPGRPNILRILASDLRDEPPVATSDLEREQVAVLSAHIDDMNPAWFGPLWDRLLSGGALDVALIPMTMKKGRPGVRLEVVARVEDEESVARIILTHTTTLGVRSARMDRFVLPRMERVVKTPWGAIRAKEAGGVWRLEHDDLVALAQRQQWSLPETQQHLTPFLAESSGEKLIPVVEFKQYDFSDTA
ncbi:MAG: nickel pincer cofactor biosynthesis protein LarC [Magnetococcales bacterium]|nr:nickel pincer cofactor biosynthesis protein LarC [Magnetococcales bacterium]